MMKELRNHQSQHEEHGTIGAYIVGFVLSLIFTIIPYYLVTQKVMTGRTLIAAILGIALLQMVIQLVFFLHLGRGPKPLYNIVFFFATAGVIVITIGASLFIMDNLYRTMSPGEIIIKQAQKENIAQIGGQETGACAQNKDSHLVIIQDGRVTPGLIEAQRCDTLSFINEDDQVYTIVFQSGSEAVSYGGEDELVLDDGRAETITLNETGAFSFSEQDLPELSGQFTVVPEQ